MSKITRIENILNDDFLNPLNYGYGFQLAGPIYIYQGFYAVKVFANSKSYDCFDAAIMVRNRLRKEGIECKIFRGKDKYKIWDSHFFVITNDGIIIDKTPPYRLINPEHIVEDEIPEDKTSNLEITLRILNGGMRPLRYTQKDERKYIVKIGGHEIFQTNESDSREKIKFVYDVTEFSGETPKLGYSIYFFLDKTLFEKLMKLEKINNPYLFTLDDLEKEGILKYYKIGFIFDTSKSDVLAIKKIPLNFVERLIDIAQEDNDILFTHILCLLNPKHKLK